MTRLPRTDDLLAFLTICLAGCAVSPIVDGDWSEESEVDSGFESSEGPATDPAGDEPGVDPNAASGDPPSEGPSAPSPGGAQKVDASASADAGGTPRDASVKDAGAKDAGRTGTGTGTSTPTPTPAPARDAGQSTTKPAAGMCRSATDCTESCVPIGILNCCRANGTCGCTWAPGAYCL